VEEALNIELEEPRTCMNPVLTASSKHSRYVSQRFNCETGLTASLFGAVTGLNLAIVSVRSSRKTDSAYHEVL